MRTPFCMLVVVFSTDLSKLKETQYKLAFNFSTSHFHFREFDRIFETNLANYLAYYFADHCGKILHINSENYWRMTDLRGEKKSLSKQNFTANCVV